VAAHKLDGTLYYMSCDQCLKKAVEVNEGQWICENHQVVNKPKARYISSAMLRDSTGEIWATIQDTIGN